MATACVDRLRRWSWVPARSRCAASAGTTSRADWPEMSLWLTLGVNSIALGGLLFLLSAGFSLIFGLMRIPNLMHGSFFMLGAYLGVTLLDKTQFNFWLAALMSGMAMAAIGGLIERLLLRRLAGQEL